jgi:hypothetical protein
MIYVKYLGLFRSLTKQTCPGFHGIVFTFFSITPYDVKELYAQTPSAAEISAVSTPNWFFEVLVLSPKPTPLM